VFILTLAQWPAMLPPPGAVEQGVRHRARAGRHKYERLLTLRLALSI
jgi:hypothetical protein